MSPIAQRGRDATSSPTTAPIAERRSEARAAPAVECRVEVEALGKSWRGAAANVSPGGLRVRLSGGVQPSGLASGVEIALVLECAGKRFPRMGRVVWTGTRPDGNAEFGAAVGDPFTGGDIPAILDMNHVRIDPVWALRVPAALAVRRQVMPFSCVDGRVQVACANSSDAASVKSLERHFELPLDAVPVEPESLRRALRRVYGDPSAAGDPENPVALCQEILYAAYIRQASDIHIDPDSEGARVRLRVDGELEEYRRVPTRIFPELMSRIKVIGGMDIAEKRAPQDGRFTQEFAGADAVDVRVATLPTKYGERATLRLLSSERESLTLERLGMSARDLGAFEQAIRRPHGLVLATGPTGCGKTTSLYAALRKITSERAVNAITVEDPIEYDIPGVAQVEVDQNKITFETALRSLLRHDPDVLMIAEIRDRETADIAIKSALTGHLVLSTLHTNSAASVVTRLDDLGVPRYLTAATLRLAMAQRLVRRLCPHCRQPVPLSADQARSLGRPALAGAPVFAPRGCVWCAGRGFNGRVGLFELFAVDDDWSRVLARGADESALADGMREKKVPGFAEDAVEKLLAGQTSLHEILAAVTL
jgi:type IV pilus assembly protein PilB